MKSTGIVKRIDDHGRIVIPIEILRTMQIKEGDRFKISLENNNICLEVYHPSNDYKNEISRIIDTLEQDEHKVSNKEDVILALEKAKNLLSDKEKEQP